MTGMPNPVHESDESEYSQALTDKKFLRAFPPLEQLILQARKSPGKTLITWEINILGKKDQEIGRSTGTYTKFQYNGTGTAVQCTCTNSYRTWIFRSGSINIYLKEMTLERQIGSRLINILSYP